MKKDKVSKFSTAVQEELKVSEKKKMQDSFAKYKKNKTVKQR